MATASGSGSSGSSYPSYLPLDRPIPGYVLNRRNGFSGGAMLPIVYVIPRMRRRGAISYDPNDVTAQYIRFLADAMSRRDRYIENPNHLPNLPPLNLNLMVTPPTGRRGSLRQCTPASSFRDSIRNTVYNVFDVELQSKISEKLATSTDWNFDVFTLRRLSEGRPLFYIGFHLLYERGLIRELDLDVVKLMKFLTSVEATYHPENCYHNSTHAADVTQALNCLLCEPKLSVHLTPIELLGALLAAICHDMDHPGVNQTFLLNTQSHLAYIHGSSSMLERHHCREARAILRETGLLDHLPREEMREIISLMDTMILATDVTQHTQFLTQFKVMNSAENPIDLSIKENKYFMLSIAIRAADISNPSRELDLSKCWSEHIMEEFFRQGDAERERQLPVSSFCDRYSTNIPKTQSGFFQFMALPLFQEWSNFFQSEFSVKMCENIKENKAYWDAILHHMEIMGEFPPEDDNTNTSSDAANQPVETEDAEQPCTTDDAAQSLDADVPNTASHSETAKPSRWMRLEPFLDSATADDAIVIVEPKCAIRPAEAEPTAHSLEDSATNAAELPEDAGQPQLPEDAGETTE